MIGTTFSGEVILLNPRDNVVVVRQTVMTGDALCIDGEIIIAVMDVAVGHKLARHSLPAGAKVVKSGAPIGSLTFAVGCGDHVHMHNLASDYIASHHRGGDGR